MQRNSTCPAIVLSTNPAGDIHSFCYLLTPEHGTLSAMAYGLRSQHSKLRATVFSFARGNCTLYTKGEQYSIKAFDLIHGHLGIRQELHRFFYASLWAEIIWISHLGIDYRKQVFDVLVDGLVLLENSTAEAGKLLNIHFLWRYLEYTGERPMLPVLAETPSKMYYDVRNHEFTSSRNANAPDYTLSNIIPITPSNISYLRSAAELPLADAMQLPPLGAPDDSIAGLNSFLRQLIEHSLGRGLKTIAAFSNMKF